MPRLPLSPWHVAWNDQLLRHQSPLFLVRMNGDHGGSIIKVYLNCRRTLNYRNLSVCSTLQQGLGCDIHVVMVTVTAYQET